MNTITTLALAVGMALASGAAMAQHVGHPHTAATQRPAAKELLPANRYVPIFFSYAILTEILRLRSE